MTTCTRALPLLLLATLCACSERTDTPTTASTSPAPPPRMRQGGPNAILVDVDGTTMTLVDTHRMVERQLDMRLARSGKNADDMDAASLESLRTSLTKSVINDFVIRALVRNEVQRRRILANTERTTQALTDFLARHGVASLAAYVQASGTPESEVRDMLTRRVQFDLLLEQDIGTTPSVTDEEVAHFYAAHKQSNIPESVRVRQILVAVPSSAKAGERKTKRKRADALRQKLLDGAEFAELATQESDCPSRQRGGDTGVVFPERFPAAYATAVRTQDINAIGKVIQTPAGFYILKVLERHAAGRIPRSSVVALLEQQKRQVAGDALIQKLRARARIRIYDR